jgi:hypothetical protein
MVGQSTGKYAPKTATGCTISAAGVFSGCGGGGGGGLNGVNAQTGSYTAVSGDNNKAILFNCAAACGLTLPTSVPAAPWTIFVSNEGVAALSVLPTSGSSLLSALGVALGTGSLNPGMGVSIWSDGTNYHVNEGGIITGSNVVPTLVQSKLVADCTSGGPPCTSITLTANVNPGDALVVELMHNDGTGTPTISDAQGDTFTLANSNLLSGEFDIQQFVACDAVGGSTTATINGVTNGYNIVSAYEFANVANSSCIDAHTIASATHTFASSQTLSTGSITTTVANDLIFVSGSNRGAGVATMTEANGYIALQTSGYVDAALSYTSFYGTKAGAGSLSDTITFVTGGLYNMQAGILALKPTTNSTAFTVGDVLMIGPGGNIVRLPAGPVGYPLTGNGVNTLPSYQPAAATAATQTACDNSTNVATTAYAGKVCNVVETGGSPLSATAQSQTIWNNTSSAYAVDLPTPTASGPQICLGNYQAKSSAISFVPGSGVTIYYKGVAGTPGSSTGLVSTGAAGDFICVEGVNSTTYMTIGAGNGAFTNN